MEELKSPWQCLRARVFERDRHLCQRCRNRSRRDLTVHHIVPRAEGGSDLLRNLVTLCVPCHDWVEIHLEFDSCLKTLPGVVGSIDFSPLEDRVEESSLPAYPEKRPVFDGDPSDPLALARYQEEYAGWERLIGVDGPPRKWAQGRIPEPAVARPVEPAAALLPTAPLLPEDYGLGIMSERWEDIVPDDFFPAWFTEEEMRASGWGFSDYSRFLSAATKELYEPVAC